MDQETTDSIVQTITTVGAILSAIVVMVGGLLAAALFVWRTKIKPELQATRADAKVAAHEVLPNSGRSLRDAIDHQGRLLVELSSSMRAMREDQTSDRAIGERQHAEMFQRLHEIESPNSEGK